MTEGEKIQLANQQVEVEKCSQCGNLMVNLDADQLAQGDLTTLKKAGVRVSNPNTDKTICVSCEYKTFGRKIADFFESDDDDDSSFYHSSGGFLGGSSFGGFGGYSGGSFGGFGGGSFSGGGASRGF